MKKQSRKSARLMTRFARAGCYAALMGLYIGWSVCEAASPKSSLDNSRLVALAAARFPNLTNCERAVLQFADIRASARGEAAACGPSSNIDDPTNDPKNADKWGHERELRASLIRWLCVDPDAVKLVDPGGINALGARILGRLDLLSVHIPFGFACRNCAIPEDSEFGLAELDNLDLSGSYTGPIDLGGIHVRGPVNMGDGFHASGPVNFGDSKIDGDLYCSGGSFRYTDQKSQGRDIWAGQRVALFVGGGRIEGVVWVCCGFQADGQVMLGGATLGDLFAFGGRFNNPGHVALDVSGANVLRTVYLNSYQDLPGLVTNGLVSFHNTKVGGMFLVFGSKFLGQTADPHGLEAYTMSVGGALVLQNVQFENGATLNLSGASVAGGLVDNEKSWPEPGKLMIDGFSYSGFYGGSPTDARSRLRWLSLQDGYHPQPYRQLAQILRNGGDEVGAREVLIAEEDARYQGLSRPARLWGAFLKTTIGYGHRPLRAIVWSLAVMLLGWGVVAMGKRAGVMRLTWPETTPPPGGNPSAGLHPLLYSLDVFLPFVNLHQEHYWWPDEAASGEVSVFGRGLMIRGSLVRYYLWLQIIAGWLLSAIFLAGVTGLIRND